MSYDIIQQKLNNGNLSNDDILEMSIFLRFDETKPDNGYDICRNFFTYILANYDGSIQEINNLIREIVDLKDYQYFDNANLVVPGFTFDCFKKASYFLDIYYKHCAKNNLHYKDLHIQTMLNKIDEKKNYLNMLTLYSPKIFKISEEKTVDAIIKYGNIKIFNHFEKYVETPSLSLKLRYAIQNINTIAKQLSTVVDSKFIQINDGKYNNYDIMLLFAFNKIQDIINIISNPEKISDDFVLDFPLFVLIIKNFEYGIIEKIMSSKKMKECEKEKCFDYFLEIMKLYEIIPDEAHNLYKMFINNENIIPTQEHINLFFQKESDELVLFLKDEKNINLDLNFDSYQSFVSKSRYKNDNEKIELYFDNTIMTQQHLECACLHNNKSMMVYILNNKVIPSKKCYDLIVTNAKYTSDEKISMIDLFVQFGYKITDNDIAFAKLHYLKLDESKYAKKFLQKEEDIFHANYKIGTNSIKDAMDIKTLCKTATRAKDFTKIKTLIKKTNTKLDNECVEILRKSYIKSKVKDELIADAIAI